MADRYEPFHEHKISSLIESQFPEFYREQGPVFVQFVKEYYKWLETDQDISNTAFTGSGYVVVGAKNANIVGHGTDFTQWFSNGDSIAIYKEDTFTSYDILTIDTVANDTFLTISANSLPDFSSVNSWYTTITNQQNPNYYLRRYMEFKDIDTTVDQFLVYFKEKYLKNIQFNTKSNIKTFLKHSLDLYRSKGTERSIDLLFRAVFGVPVQVYYPGNDIFRLSDGKWYRPTYLEISLKKDSDKLIGKQIVGAISGATAFAEALVRRTVKGRIIDVLYISAVKGYFVIDEPINTSDFAIDTTDRPAVVGSMTYIDVDIDGTGANYRVGDFVDIYSDYGEQGKGKVTGIIDATGKVTFDLENGGYGYRATSEVLVSDKIIGLANLNIDANNTLKSYVDLFDYMVQPLANIQFDTLTSGMFANGDLIYTWDGGLQKGVGRIIDMANTSATAGYVFVSVLSGNLEYSKIYSAGNTRNANVVLYTDATCTGNTIGYYANVQFTISSVVGSFTPGEEVYQADHYGLIKANGTVETFGSLGGGQSGIKVSNTYGVFQKNWTLRGRSSNASGNVQSTFLYIGVKDISNVFYNTTNNYVYFANSLSNGTITTISQGSLANVGFSNSLIYTETVTLSNDYITTNATHYLPVALNAVQYNFPLNPTGNLTSGTLASMFSEEAYLVGKIQQLEGINKGSDYTAAPIVRVYDPITTWQYSQDMILEITGADGVFQDGEVVTQESNSGRGLVKYSNATHIAVELLRMHRSNNFIITANTTTILVGERSAATANIVQVDVDNRSEYLGFNAQIDTSVAAVAGSVANLAVISSGFGYRKNDSLRFVREGLPIIHEDAGFGFANLVNQGYGQGYYKKNNGWLSDRSKLYDGYYYQDYSYEIRSSITLNKYEEMLKQLLHVAGTKHFAAFVYKTDSTLNTSFNATTITQS